MTGVRDTALSHSSGDFYERLGVAPGCSEADVRSAYRARAKKLHPDANSNSDASREFSELHEAYSTLSDSAMRAKYDEARAEQPRADGAPLEPLSCFRCKKFTAQPRYLVFRYVISVIFTTVTTPIQGVFCTRCAHKESLRATATSAAFGWWGFPWGLIRTPQEIIRNALGGVQPPGSEQRLLWYNALAFLQRGNLDISYGLARRVRSMSEDQMAHNASELASILVSRGQSPDAPPLKNPWVRARNPSPHFLMLGALPVLAIIFIVIGASSYHPIPVTVTSGATLTQIRVSAGSSHATTDNPVASTPVSVPSPVAEPACLSPPPAGEILSGTPPTSNPGHVLEISNGSEGPAIVKVRYSPSKQLAFAFFVPASATARISGIPDGVYNFQYATGTALGADCRSLTDVRNVSEFPDAETLTTTYEDSRVGTKVLSYTLYGVPAGNVSPNTITPETFNAP